MAETQQETIAVPQQPVVIKPLQPAQTQSSFASCPSCGKYEPIGTLQCSQCFTSFVVTPPNNNNNVPQNKPHVPSSPGPIDWNHQGKVNSILIATTFHIFALFFIISSYFTSWFTRTPLYNLSVIYYLDHAEYSETITGYDKIQYSECDSMDGESCNDMKDFENISAPLFLTSFIILCIIVIFGAIVIVPYQCYCCRDNKKFLILSAKSRINYSLAFIFICQLIVFSFTISAIAPFVTNFPYLKYCYYQEYDDDGIGCEWGSGATLATTANAIIFGCAMFIFGAMLFLRDFSASSQPKSVAAPSNPGSQQAANPNANLLAAPEGIVNYNQAQQPQQPVMYGQPGPYGQPQPYAYQQQPYYMPDYREINKGKKRTNWKIFAIWAVAAAMGIGYAIIINTSMIPNSDHNAMPWITNKWNNAQCFKPNTSESLANGYYDTPHYFPYSQEDVCSFTYPNETNYEMLPQWYSCCTSDLCGNAFNYTDPLNFASTACEHALAVVTKGSCHPLAAQFTPKTNDIRYQSNSIKGNGVYICAMYCKQIWNDCDGATWNGQDITSSYSDELDFCTNGLGVNVRSEVFTDQCLDDAYSIFNVYMFILFLIFGILSV